jgi:hypothetical protein
MSWTVAAGTETPPGPRTWPVIDPVAGAWPKSKDGSTKANAERAAQKGMRFVRFVDTPAELLNSSFELTKVQTVIDLAGLQNKLVCSPLFDR